ncbi:hypothetical protein E8K88_13825 [Lampropedia aestuarii]|uniref:Uncharacterized protein n=1 Tax=Lampropedia aestuarii TaxID=2562762 RepID=A0A4S5BM71_9BURK|nr:hypothetical protein [Lampropedia aestuarii]THJ31901.1 hypothetical protein E8K88_13825 [Lampropedia aestuarii]
MATLAVYIPTKPITSAFAVISTMTPLLSPFQYFCTTKGKLALLIGTALALIGGYYSAPHLPPVLGWENGLLENTQVVILLFGGCWAYAEATNTGRQPNKAFWWVITPIWFVMALRELSWGAVLLMPLYMDPITGPIFSSTQQLFYKPLVSPVLVLLVVGQLAAALRWRLDRLLPVLWRANAIPLLEFSLFVACFLVSTAAEGHMGMHISGLDEGSAQLLEEWAELLAYIALFIGQARVLLALRKHSATNARV